MRSVLNSSAVWELTAEGERLFHCGIVRGKKEFFRASLYVWYLQYWALCDDLVDFKLRAGVRYLSFSIDTAKALTRILKTGVPELTFPESGSPTIQKNIASFKIIGVPAKKWEFRTANQQLVKALTAPECIMKEKQGGLIPTGLKRWPLKLIKHLADTTCVTPSPAGPTGCCPLNFLYLINLKF